MRAKENPDRYMIHSVEKALSVIEVLSEYDTLNLIELAEMVNQPKSSLYRILLTLRKRGYVESDADNDGYRIGTKSLEITKNILEGNPLRKAALPNMKQLVRKYGDTVNLSVLKNGSILYVEIIEGTHSLRMSESVGSRAPFHATAVGKAIAAFLPEEEVDELIEQQGLPAITKKTIDSQEALKKELATIKKRGYALDDGEIEEGAKCVAAPIFDMFDHVIGAVSISGAEHRFSEEKTATMAVDIKEEAVAISKKLGYTGEIGAGSNT